MRSILIMLTAILIIEFIVLSIYVWVNSLSINTDIWIRASILYSSILFIYLYSALLLSKNKIKSVVSLRYILSGIIVVFTYFLVNYNTSTEYYGIEYEPYCYQYILTTTILCAALSAVPVCVLMLIGDRNNK